MTNKIRFTLLLIFVALFDIKAQYSTYYNINKQSNINANITGSIYSHSTQTINTIDYGALALANAQREQNKIEQQKITDEKQRKMFSEIIAEPIKAYDYGTWSGFNSKDKKVLDKNVMKQYESITGLKRFGYYFVFPAHFFTALTWLNWQNVSNDGVITEIFLNLPVYNTNKLDVDFESSFEKDTLNVVGKESVGIDDLGKQKKVFYHKKELNLATVFNAHGHKATYIWEDKFENGITDNYHVYYNNSAVAGNGIQIGVKVRYRGDKDDVSFEMLEGRRYYLKNLLEKIISTARIQDLVFFK